MWKCQPAEGRHGRLARVEGRPEPLGDPGCRGLLESTVHWEGPPWGLEGAARMPPCHAPGHAPSPVPPWDPTPHPRTPCLLEPPALGAWRECWGVVRTGGGCVQCDAAWRPVTSILRPQDFLRSRPAGRLRAPGLSSGTTHFLAARRQPPQSPALLQSLGATDVARRQQREPARGLDTLVWG